MKQKSEIFSKIVIIVLLAIAILLAYFLLSDIHSSNNPNLMIVFGLFTTVIILVAFGSWVGFTGETQHKTLLLVSLFVATALVFALANFVGLELTMASPGWKDLNPTAVYNLSVTVYSLLILSFILGIETLAVLIHIVKARRK